jgi:hypothetical protein
VILDGAATHLVEMAAAHGSRAQGTHALWICACVTMDDASPSDFAKVGMKSDWGPDRALYGISVAAELTGVSARCCASMRIGGWSSHHSRLHRNQMLRATHAGENPSDVFASSA